MSRFDYIAYDAVAQVNQGAFKDAAQAIEAEIDHRLRMPDSGRARALALTSLEECYMWLGKGVRDEQIARNGGAPLQEGRGVE